MPPGTPPGPGPEPAALGTGGSVPPGSGWPGGYPGAPGGYPAGYPAPEPVLVQIGEIQVTSTSIRTPAGVFPLAGSQWYVTDHTYTEDKIPTWAIVLAIVLFCVIFVFSLLFLLARETVVRTMVQVQVDSEGYRYVARIPAAHQGQVQYLYQQVNYVRSLAVQ